MDSDQWTAVSGEKKRRGRKGNRDWVKKWGARTERIGFDIHGRE